MAWTLCSGTRKKERVRILGNVKLSARLSAVPDNAQSSLSIKMSGFWKFNNAAISIGYLGPPQAIQGHLEFFLIGFHGWNQRAMNHFIGMENKNIKKQKSQFID